MRSLASALLILAAAPASAQDADPLEALEQRTAEITRAAARAVVAVTSITEPSDAPQVVFPGLRVAPLHREGERVEATGFVVSLDGAAGTIATTIDLVRDTARYEVRFADGTVRAARLLGADEPFRLAVLRADAPEGTRVLSDAAGDVEPGRRPFGWLLAAVPGADPDVQLTSVRTAACPESTYDRYLAGVLTLRTGGAGGPMLARDGRLLGMAVGSVGDCMSLPATGSKCRSTLFVRGDDLIAAAREIARSATATQPGHVRRARLGVMLDADTNRVDQILPGSPAELAGVREGDEVVSVAGAPVATAAGITRGLLRRRTGEAVVLEIRRGTSAVRATVTLDDIGLPGEPTTPPFAGALLEMSWRAGTDAAPPAQVVAFLDVEKGSVLAESGVRAGDELVSVEGMDALRYLSRHRVRPAPQAPSEIVVRRAEGETKLALRRPERAPSPPLAAPPR